jgi:hypothetical protein
MTKVAWRAGALVWVYEDGTVLPVVAGGDETFPPAETTAKVDGATIFDADGNPVGVIRAPGPEGGAWVIQNLDGSTRPLTGGPYNIGAGKAVWVTDQGEVLSTGQLKDSSGTGGSGGTVVGSAAPDPVGAATIWLTYYQNQVANRKMTYDAAFEAWKGKVEEIFKNADIEAANVANKLQADIQNATVGLGYDQLGFSYKELEQKRAEAMAAQQLGIQGQATERGRIMAQLLPYSLPKGVTMNLPGAGAVPENLVNPAEDLFGGLPSLKSMYEEIPEMFPTVGLPPPRPAPIVAGPIGDISLPDAPMFELPPSPFSDSTIGDLAGKAAAGSSGWVVS